MNKYDITYVFGCFVTVVNSIAVTSSCFAFFREFWKAVKCDEHVRLINFHFTFCLIVCMPFFAANMLAWYRFYDSWLIKHSLVTLGLMMNGFSDRILMTICSLGLVILSMIKTNKIFCEE